MDYGHEGWHLSEAVIKMIGSWNARCLAVITSRSVAEEYRKPSYDFITALRVRRLKWVGKVLRKDESRLDRRVLMSKTKPYVDGDILMDCPEHESMDKLYEMAMDEKKWSDIIKARKKELDKTFKK